MKTTLFLLFIFSHFSHALISGSVGNSPVSDRGWAPGSVELANLKTRVAHWEGPPYGGGQTTFEFKGKSTADFMNALEAFAKIKGPRRELVIQSGPRNSFWLRPDSRKEGDVDSRIDWSFVVWNESVWNQMYNDPKNSFMSDSPNFRKPVDCPKIYLYLGGGTVKWKEVNVPKGVTVVDQRNKSGKGAVVSGIVRELESGKPMAGVEVTLIPGTQKIEGKLPTVVTGADGKYELKNFPKGGYYVVARKEGFATKRSLAFSEMNGADSREEMFALSKTTNLKGIVKGPNGEPLEGVRVILRNIIGKDGFGYLGRNDFETKTDKEGGFVFDGLPEGECRATAWLEGYFNPDGILGKYEIPSSKPIEIKMIGTGTIRGIMPAPKKGQHKVMMHPPGGNKVGSWGGSMNYKEDGSFEFKNVPEGEYYIGRDQGGDLKLNEPGVKKIEVKAGKISQVSFEE